VIAVVGILVPCSHIADSGTEKFTTAIKSCAGELSQIISRIM
jgi:hypothetical protein